METLPPISSSQEERIINSFQLGNAPMDREIGTGVRHEGRNALIAELRMGNFTTVLNSSPSKVNGNGNGKSNDAEKRSAPAIVPERKPAPLNGGMSVSEMRRIEFEVRREMGIGRRNR